MSDPTLHFSAQSSEFDCPDPLALFENLREKSGLSFLYKGRDDAEIWMGFGLAQGFAADRGCRPVLESIAGDDLPFSPRMFSAIQFSKSGSIGGLWTSFDLPPFLLPQIIIRWRDNLAGMLVLTPANSPHVPPEFDVKRFCAPSAEKKEKTANAVRVIPRTQIGTWRQGIEIALRAMESGPLKKVVLSRTTSAFSDQPFNIGSILSELLKQDGCSVFALHRGDAVFLGASPERLFRLDGNTISTESLAGTRPRGQTDREDKKFAAALFESEKELREHNIVRDFIASHLKDLCMVQHVGKPAVRKLNTMQHLYTPLTGTLRENVGMDDVLKALHPTPAVCGEPRDEASALIDRLEAVPRGFYTGVLGWADAASAELTVAIRCALIRGQSATVFAGAGIVSGSDADAEWEETEDKMKPVLNALGRAVA
ncbi:isochorismate synthase [candidate division KSB1 bacterium]|nr:MAG: isochorismate synthase [candidate division KSB1 bacterium]